MDQTRQIESTLWQILRDTLQLAEQRMQDFVGPLENWVNNLLSTTLPDDWRHRLARFLELWESEGFSLTPESTQVLEDWILEWAVIRKLLPTVQLAEIEPVASGHGFVVTVIPDVSGPPQPSPSQTRPQLNLVDGVEVAGPGPATTRSFQAKVRQALEIIDPQIANWWRAHSVDGQVRSRAAMFYEFAYYTELAGPRRDQPVIVVDQDFTAGRTAQAIVSEVRSGLFADSIGVFYRKYKFARKPNPEEFTKWMRGSAREAGRLASVLAELYYASLVSFIPGGDLFVTIDDFDQNGPQWTQLFSLLPLLSFLPLTAIVIKLGKRELRISKELARELDTLSEAERKLLAGQIAGKAEAEAKAIIEQAVAAKSKVKSAPAKSASETDVAKSGKNVTKQVHHPISKTVYDALQEHRRLRGKYKSRDPRFKSEAVDYDAHHGLQDWHRKLDAEVAAWIKQNEDATPKIFERYLRDRYNEPDLKRRFPNGI